MIKLFLIKKIKGFTLVELLVVIAIISILSTVVFAVLSESRERARDAKRISDLKNIELALEVYFSDNGHYPIRTTRSSPSPPPPDQWSDLATDLAPYIKLPSDPYKNNGKFPDNSVDGQYNYHYHSDGNGYNLVTKLEQDHEQDCIHNQAVYLANIDSGDYIAEDQWCGIGHEDKALLYTP